MSNVPGILPVAVPVSSAEADVVRDVSQPLSQARGWMKFYGIMLIISGIPSALALVGIIPIWQGVLLMQAASSLETSANTGQKYAFLSAQNNLKTFFVMNGVLMLVGLVIAVLSICAAIVIQVVMGISLLSIFNSSRSY